MIRIVIVDDQEMVRESLRILLSTQGDFEVVGIGKDGYDAMRLVNDLMPDVLLLDIRMPIMDGVKATAMLKSRSPATAIIILTTFDDDEYVQNAILNGASGYLLKSAGMEGIARAIRTVHEGGSLMTPQIATKAFRLFSELARNREGTKSSMRFKAPTAASRDGISMPTDLSRTEIQIMALIGQGLANKETAARLKLGEGTVRNYISSILQKTGLRDRTQIALFAVRHGLVENHER